VLSLLNLSDTSSSGPRITAWDTQIIPMISRTPAQRPSSFLPETFQRSLSRTSYFLSQLFTGITPFPPTSTHDPNPFPGTHRYFLYAAQPPSYVFSVLFILELATFLLFGHEPFFKICWVETGHKQLRAPSLCLGNVLTVPLRNTFSRPPPFPWVVGRRGLASGLPCIK